MRASHLALAPQPRHDAQVPDEEEGLEHEQREERRRHRHAKQVEEAPEHHEQPDRIRRARPCGVCSRRLPLRDARSYVR